MITNGIEAGASNLGARIIGSTIFGLLATYALTQYQDELRAFMQSISLNLARKKFLDKRYLGVDLEYIVDFESRIKELKGRIPEDRMKTLLSLMVHYIRLLNQREHSLFLNNFRHGIEALFDLPYEFHDPIDEELIAEVKKTVSFDYPQIEDQINNYIDQLTQYINDKSNPKPNPLLLLGPPGVGKTRLVKEIILKGLKVPVYYVSFAESQVMQLEEEPRANLCNDYNEGVIFKALRHASKHNNHKGPVIIFIDDICTAFTKDKELYDEQKILSWLTPTLDPDLKVVTSHLFDKYTQGKGISLDMDNCLFIAAANSDHFLKTEGMQRRLRSRIIFPNMTLEKKTEIARKYSEKLEQIKVESINKRTDLKEDRKEREIEKITLTAEDKKAIDLIAQIDPYPGAGTMIDTINKWYASKKVGSDFNIQSYYDRITRNMNHSESFTPGYTAFSSNASADPARTENNSEENALEQLLKKLSLADMGEKEKFLNSLLKAGIISQSQFTPTESEGDGKEKEVKKKQGL